MISERIREYIGTETELQKKKKLEASGLEVKETVQRNYYPI